MRCIAGIDYSMTAPAICIFDMAHGDFHIDGCKFLAVLPVDKQKTIQTSILDGKINIIRGVDSKVNEHRFDFLASSFTNLMIEYNVTDAALEGYAMGAKGQVFSIGENAGVLKNRLFRASINIEVYTPTELKQFAHGKGSATKRQMHDAFIKETGIDLMKAYKFKGEMPNKGKNPIDDIVDSYYVAKMLWYNVKHKEQYDGS